jgi:hypothetical protein
MPDAVPEFSDHFRRAWQRRSFVKLTLSEPVLPSEQSPRNLKARPVQLKEGLRVSILECFATREQVRNWEMEDALRLLARELSESWRRAHLFTTEGDYVFERRTGASPASLRVRSLRPTFTQAPSLCHDRQNAEQAQLASALFLQRLGITNASGQPRPGKAGKLRQVQRFVELFGHLLDEWAPETPSRPLAVADMGAGKGYLTFALAWELQRRGVAAHVTGVEQRGELVASANALSRELGWEGLRFEEGRIGQWKAAEGLDVLVALHACNTATDDALVQGIQAGAALLLTSPCCHQELRPQLNPQAPLNALLRHGILKERMSEILTDGIRALLLEAKGYRARVFEFVEPEHSGKNLMLSALRQASGVRPPEQVWEEIRRGMEFFGIERHRLADLLGASN